MKRLSAIFLAVVVCCTLSVAAVSVYIDFKYPNYTRDSGAPPLLPGIIFGGPAGFLFGILVGAAWPLRRN